MSRRRTARAPEDELVALGRMLGHPLRVRILDALAERDASASALAPGIGASVENVSYHMKILLREGAIELRKTRQERGGVERIYRLKPRTRADLSGLRAWLGQR